MKRSIIRVTMTDQNDTQRLLQFYERSADRRTADQRADGQPVARHDLLGAQREETKRRGVDSRSHPEAVRAAERGVFAGQSVFPAQKKPRRLPCGARLYHLGGGK